MNILELITAPDPLLNMVSKRVEIIDDQLQNFMKDMITTMYHERGIGLAAVQVGVLKRILVMDVDYENDDHFHDHDNCNSIHVKNTNPQYFVNPEIIEFSKIKTPYNEGCLSFPGARAEIIRPDSVVVKYLDFNAKEQVKKFTGISATCIQHEIDHLNGITFVDHISSLKRDFIIRKMKKIKNKK